MTLDKSGALPRGAGVAADRPADQAAATKPQPREPENPIMPLPRPEAAPNGRNGDSSPESWTLADVIAETEALRTSLQEASGRTARLLSALKHQRRQSRAVKAAMDSLRQLQLDR
jgi:hypothetical protein